MGIFSNHLLYEHSQDKQIVMSKGIEFFILLKYQPDIQVPLLKAEQVYIHIYIYIYVYIYIYFTF